MKIKEYEAYKKHILRYMTIEDLKENLKHHTPEQLVHNRFFVSNYEVVLDTFEKIYGDEYCPYPYVTNDGLHLRFRKGEAYCWTVYVNKMTMAIKKLVKE